ncbi:MAG: zf-HC2 domain-containing protein [Acidobacteriota bacterium]
MTDLFRAGWEENQQHPTQEQLLLDADGELAPAEAAQMQAHLEACWSCRAKTARIEETIAGFVEYEAAVLTPHLPRPPRNWQRFSPQLSRWAEEIGRPPLLSRLRVWLTVKLITLRFAAGAISVVCLIALAGVWLTWSPQVSASELLQRSAQADAARLSRVTEPVAYRKIQVRRRTSVAVANAEESVAWESWSEARSHQFRQRVADRDGLRFIGANERPAPAIITELEHIFQANRLDARRPLSAAAYAGWRGGVRRKSESVTEVTLLGGETGLRLTTAAEAPFAGNAIIEASLVVRRQDWHAVAQHLKVQGENEIREYELSETAYEVLPLQALTVFADIAPTPPATVLPAPSAARPRMAASPSPLPKAMPAESALKDAQVAALYALHQVQADLGEQIEIVRDPAGQMVVRGLVETPERRQQVTEALQGIPLVAAQIQTVEEAARQASVTQSSPAAQADPVSEPAISATPDTNAFEQRLARYFAEREPSPKSNDPRNVDLKIAQLSNDVVSESSIAMWEAWALRRLVERFAAEKENEFSPTARRRIEEMMTNHLTRLKTQSRNLRARLEPILISIAGDGAPVLSAPAPSESTKQALALLVFRAVEQVQQMTHRLFAGTGSATTPEEAARQLLEALMLLDHALLSFEREIAR